MSDIAVFLSLIAVFICRIISTSYNLIDSFPYPCFACSCYFLVLLVPAYFLVLLVFFHILAFLFFPVSQNDSGFFIKLLIHIICHFLTDLFGTGIIQGSIISKLSHHSYNGQKHQVYLRGIFKCIRPNGTILISFPNAGSDILFQQRAANLHLSVG